MVHRFFGLFAAGFASNAQKWDLYLKSRHRPVSEKCSAAMSGQLKSRTWICKEKICIRSNNITNIINLIIIYSAMNFISVTLVKRILNFWHVIKSNFFFSCWVNMKLSFPMKLNLNSSCSIQFSTNIKEKIFRTSLTFTLCLKSLPIKIP